jgi:hypothetical protein
MKARELKETIAQLESQIQQNNVRLRRTRDMVTVMTEHLRSNSAAPKVKPGDES